MWPFTLNLCYNIRQKILHVIWKPKVSVWGIITHLLNPSWRAMSSACELLLPLRQWNTMLSSSFPGALTANFCWKRSGDSFRDSSRVPTDIHKHADRQCEGQGLMKTTLYELSLTWDVDSVCNASGLVLVGISHVEELNVTIGQHGLQLRVGHHRS